MKLHAGTSIARVAVPLLLGLAQVTRAGAQVKPTRPDTTQPRASSTPMASGATMMSGPHHVLAMAYGESLANFARVLNADASQSQSVNVELARPATIEMRRSLDQMKTHHAAQMAATFMGTRAPMRADSAADMAMRMPTTADSAAGMIRPVRPDSMRKPRQPGRRLDSARVRPMTPPSRADSMMGQRIDMPKASDSASTAGMGGMQSQMAAIEKHLEMLETEVNAAMPDAATVVKHTAEIIKIREMTIRMPSDRVGVPRAPGTP